MKLKARSIAQGGQEGTRAMRTSWEEMVIRKVSGGQTGGAYSLFEVEVAPGGEPPPQVHHREDECLYVLEGQFRVLHENRETGAGPGSLIYIPKGDLHAFENVAETTGRLLSIQTPGGAYERLVQDAGTPESESAPDAGTFIEIAASYGTEVAPAHAGERVIRVKEPGGKTVSGEEVS